MNAAILLFAAIVLAAAPALAKTIRPADASKHAGQTVTVEGVVSEVRHIATGREIFIALGGRYPETVFRAAILGDDTARFPHVDRLLGRTVAVTGEISLYEGRAEILVHDPGQVDVK